MAVSEEFARLRLSGGRFDQHVLPLDVLPELVTLQVILVETAKVLYRRAHPSRERLPKGFAASLRLHLGPTIPGSSVEQMLLRGSEVGQRGLPGVNGEFEEARDLTWQFLEQGWAGEVPAFPPNVIPLVLRFGQTLRPDEAMSLWSPDGAGARWDQDRRHGLMARRGERQGPVVVLGRVSDLDNADERFEVLTEDGVRIEGPYGSTEDFSVLQRAQSATVSEGARIRIEGEARLDASNRPTRFLQVESVVEIGSRGWAEQRLDDLSRHEDGWHDGTGLAVSDEALEKARGLVEHLAGSGLPQPRLSPTPDGGIEATWPAGRQMLTVEFDRDGSGYLLAFDLDSNAVLQEIDGEVAMEEAVAAVARLLRRP